VDSRNPPSCVTGVLHPNSALLRAARGPERERRTADFALRAAAVFSRLPVVLVHTAVVRWMIGETMQIFCSRSEGVSARSPELAFHTCYCVIPSLHPSTYPHSSRTEGESVENDGVVDGDRCIREVNVFFFVDPRPDCFFLKVRYSYGVRHVVPQYRRA